MSISHPVDANFPVGVNWSIFLQNVANHRGAFHVTHLFMGRSQDLAHCIWIFMMKTAHLDNLSDVDGNLLPSLPLQDTDFGHSPLWGDSLENILLK